MNNADNLRVMFDTITAWTKSIRDSLNLGVSKPAEKAAGDVASLKAELEKLGKQQESVKSLRAMRGELADTNKALADARERVGTLSRSLQASGQPSQRLIAALANATGAVSELETKQRGQTRAIGALSSELGAAGLNTRNLAAQQRALKGNIDATTTSLEHATRQEENREKWSKRREAIKEGSEKLGEAGNWIREKVNVAMDEAKKFEDVRARMLAAGANEKSIQAAEHYARTAQLPGVSTVEKFSYVSDAQGMTESETMAEKVADQFAKVHFTNLALYDAQQAQANDTAFKNLAAIAVTRGALKDNAHREGELDNIQQLIAANRGDIKANELVKFATSAGAAANGLSSAAMWFQSNAVINTLGGGDKAGSALAVLIDNLADGHGMTPQSIGALVKDGLLDRKGIHYGKDGKADSFAPDALKDVALLRQSPAQWLRDVLLPLLKARGIDSPEQINAEISTLFSKKEGADYMRAVYANLDKIGSDEHDATSARTIAASATLAATTTRGKEAALKAGTDTLKLQAGESTQPAYNASLDAAQTGLGKLTPFIDAHRGVAQTIGTVTTVLGDLLAGAGMLAGGLFAAIGALKTAKSLMSALGGSAKDFAGAVIDNAGPSGNTPANTPGGSGKGRGKGSAARRARTARAAARNALAAGRNVTQTAPVARNAISALAARAPAVAAAGRGAATASIASRLLGRLGGVGRAIAPMAATAARVLGGAGTAGTAVRLLGGALRIGSLLGGITPAGLLLQAGIGAGTWAFEHRDQIKGWFSGGAKSGAAAGDGPPKPGAATAADPVKPPTMPPGDASKIPSMVVSTLTASQLLVGSSLASAALLPPLTQAAMPDRPTMAFDMRAPLNSARPPAPTVVTVPAAPAVINVYAPANVDARVVAQLVREELDKRDRELRQRATAALHD
ncbi:phage tail tape measure protein [Burkholderia sp. 3C]